MSAGGGIPFAIVDAFTAEPFAGNPAAVCLLAGPARDGWMQRVAAEMNLSETAFLDPREDGFGLRWFTPTVEADLCGHATLAAAHVLAERGELAGEGAVRFHTRSGVLSARRDGARIALDFPATPPEAAAPPAGLLEALGVNPLGVFRTRFDWLVEVRDEAEVRRLDPDVARLRRVEARGVIVTARATGPEHDFVSRFFAPAGGIDEDPVTGSAHCSLGPFWSARLGRSGLAGYQASARGGRVEVRCLGGRVELSGRAVTVARGELSPAAGAGATPPG